MSSIKDIAEKLRKMELRLSEKPNEKPFKFFGLFLRQDYDKWDLLVSAEWLDKDVRSGVESLVKEINKTLDQEEILKLSRIVPYPTGDDIPNAFAKAISTNHGLVEVRDSNFFGIPIKEAFIITAR
ncbi:MAG TPA: hypothetical protein VKQ34_02120 [Candidatus Saccharimonadales bacterium]|nr:hypothetical protein [Candidatus Saccharimonadales bacterium]